MTPEPTMNGEFLLNELKMMKEQLKDVPKSVLQKFVNNELEDEKKELIKLYKKEISDLPRDDPVKLEILNLMLYLGINPFDVMDIQETLSLG